MGASITSSVRELGDNPALSIDSMPWRAADGR